MFEPDILKIIVIAIVCVAALAVLFTIGTVIWTIVKSVKTRNFTKLKYNLVSVLCVILAAASWIFNFGWIRFFLTFTGLPVFHAVTFFFLNNFAASHIDKSRILKISTILCHVAYLTGYFCLPDAGDVDPMCAFFTLIRNEYIVNLFFIISFLGFSGSIVCLIVELIEASMIKAKSKSKNK
uniref:Uncharacterized protein n=1 Tax=uncultured Bacillota bacterium TaxID=344338 RepID=A0A650ENJ4_9FIRM|nr:hypothetical protein Firmicute1046_2720 [uncultured Firmicutes bacterium]